MAVLPSVLLGMYSAETEVCDLQASLPADEQVGWLQVPVHHLLAVEEGDPSQQHLHVGLDLQYGEITWSLF